jgi:hypothetical protein
MLVPAMQWIGTRYSSSTLMTPTCAAPRAPPPERTRQTFGRWVPVAGGVTASFDAASAAAGTNAAAAIDAAVIISTRWSCLVI